MPVGAAVLYRVGMPLSVALRACPIAVAGTREPTTWGRQLSRELGQRLAENGYTVVTGLAHGIDEETTIGALEVGGRVVAVLPYLIERGSLNPRATWLLHIAPSYNASVSVVAENLVKDEKRVRAWLAARNRIIVKLAKSLVVPESRYKPTHWGTRYAVEYAMKMGRPVVVLEPRTRNVDVVKAFRHFVSQGALAARDVNETLRIIKHLCGKP
jgi:DNA processing protein